MKTGMRVCLVFCSFLVFLVSTPKSVFAKFCFDDRCDKYFLDTDGGDDPQTPGCFTISNNSSCTPRSPLQYDRCGEDNELTEIVGNSQCSKNEDMDYKYYNCDEWCKQQYGEEIMGLCVSEVIPECRNQLIGYCGCYNR